MSKKNKRLKIRLPIYIVSFEIFILIINNLLHSHKESNFLNNLNESLLLSTYEYITDYLILLIILFIIVFVITVTLKNKIFRNCYPFNSDKTQYLNLNKFPNDESENHKINFYFNYYNEN